MTHTIERPFHTVYMTDNGDGTGYVHGEAIDGTEFNFSVSSEGIRKYLEGHLIQDCFPEADMWDREVVVTGYTKQMWEEMEKQVDEESNLLD